MTDHTSALEAGKRQMLRHTLATIAYRGRKALADAPADFGTFSVSSTSRTPGQILAHICDLYDWALWLCKGEHTYKQSEPGDWDADVARFFEALTRLDTFLASDAALGRTPELIFQAPIADSLTHLGQISMLRRIAGSPVRGESYARAEIVTGRVGREQAAPVWEFD
jgi:hypothetical protein